MAHDGYPAATAESAEPSHAPEAAEYPESVLLVTSKAAQAARYLHLQKPSQQPFSHPPLPAVRPVVLPAEAHEWKEPSQEEITTAILRARSIPQPPRKQYVPRIPPDQDDTPRAGCEVASNGGHGTREALEVTKLLEAAGIPCWCCGVSALIFYGAGRVRQDWEICIPSNALPAAEALLRSDANRSKYIVQVPHPDPWPGSLVHTYPRWRLRNVAFCFVLVPSRDVHMHGMDQAAAADPDSVIVRSLGSGLPYPLLDVYIQSLLDSANRVDLTDAVDGSNVSEGWGLAHLDLDGSHDVPWAEWKAKAIRASTGGSPMTGVITRPHSRREMFRVAVQFKQARLGWTRPSELFLTPFRMRDEPDPWLKPREAS